MESVVEANAEEVFRLVPLIIFLLLVILTGIPGNLMVCAVYRKKFTRTSSSFFIFALATVDLTGCIMISLEVSNVVQQYTFTNAHLCKAIIFLELWPLLTSGCLLIVISVDRYRKVCHPFGWQLSVRYGKYLFAFSVTLSLIFSLPVLFLYGSTEVQTHVTNMTGTACNILEEYKESIYSRIFNAMFLLEFVVALTTLTVLYSLICYKVIKHEKAVRPMKKCTAKREEESEMESDSYSKNASPSVLSASPSQQSFQRKPSDLNKGNNRLRGSMVNRRTTTKLTLMMCVISIVFIISYLPYTILRLLEVFQQDFVESMSNAGRACYQTILRTYFLNCAINPFIYCACSSKFRKDLIGAVRRFFSTTTLNCKG